MDTKRTLRLRRDVLAVLADDELETVVGAIAPEWAPTEILCPVSRLVRCIPIPQSLGC